MMLLLLFAALLVPVLTVCRRRLHVVWLDALLIGFVWTWANLILTANLLSIFGQLNNRVAYAVLAIGLSAGSAFGLRMLSRLRPIADSSGLLAAPPPAREFCGWLPRVLLAALVLLLVLGLLWNLLVALVIQPANPDTLMYRLPRVWWYLAQGNLRHFAESVDPRTVFYPFNVSLIYMPLALYGAAPVAFNLPSVIAWMAVIVATFQLSRWLGANRVVAVFTAFLVAFAPIVFIEATSMNDEIIAAAAVVIGIYFFLRYFRGGSRADLGTGALGLGCGLGAKLHFFFFWPAVLVLGGWFLLAAWRNPVLRNFALDRRRVRDVIVALMVAIVLSVPFLIYNRLSSPHFAYSGDEARNSPFAVKVAGQTLGLLTGQLFLSPFSTFETSPKAKVRQARILEWNAWWNKWLYPNVDQSKSFTYVTYQFLGVTNPMGGNHFENSEWAGLLPWLLIVTGFMLVARGPSTNWMAISLAIALAIWWITYGVTMKYFDTVGVYFAYPLIVCGSFVAVALGSDRRWIRRTVWTLAMIVAIGHLLLVRNIILFNPHFGLNRVVAALYSGRTMDASMPRFGLGPVLEGLNRATILLTHWAVPYYEIIKTAPEIPYFIDNPGKLTSGATITAVQANPAFDGYLPVKVEIPADRGLIYLDTILCSYGPELIFGDAPSFRDRLPKARSRYLVFKTTLDETSPSGEVRMSPLILGGEGIQRLQYRYTLFVDGMVRHATAWSADPGANLLSGKIDREQIALKIEVADTTGKSIGESMFQPFCAPQRKKYHAIYR